MTVKERIRVIAALKKMSIPELEKQCGFGHGTISKWDTAEPSATKLYAVAKTLNTTMEYLLTGDVPEDAEDRTPCIDTFTEGDKALLRVLKGASEEQKLQVARVITALKTPWGDEGK